MNKTPDLRFKGFDGAWEKRIISEVAEIITGGTPDTAIKEYWEPKEIPWLSSGEVHKKYVTYTDDMISQEGLEKSSAKIVEENSVLIALAGQGKTRGTVAINRIPLSTNQSVASVVFNNEMYPEFIFSNLENRYEELRALSSGSSSRGGLSKGIISDICIPYTSIEEQKKIGNCLCNLDQLMNSYKCKCDKLTIFKSTMLQKMFPKAGETIPEIRFPGFGGAWEENLLSNITDIKKGQQLNKNNIVENGEYYHLNGGIGPSNRTNLFNAEANTISISEGGNSCGFVGFNSERFFSGGHNYTLINLNEKINVLYLYSYLKYIEKSIMNLRVGGALPNIQKKDICNLIIHFPSLEEQQKIGSFFKSLDELIERERKQIEMFKTIKQTLLDKMFVGGE